MDYFTRALGASLIAFPLAWFFVGRRQIVAGGQKVKVVVTGVVLTACLCVALLYASQFLFSDFVVAKPGGGLSAVFYLGAPLGFAFVVARLMRPLNLIPRLDQLSPSGDREIDVGEVNKNRPTRR